MTKRAGAFIALVLSIPTLLVAEPVATMTLKGLEGATQAQLEEAGQGIAARCKVAGFDGILCFVREGAIELRAPDGFDDKMQFSIAALGYFPAKKVELRLMKRYPDYVNSFITLEAVNALVCPPNAFWMPYQHLRPTDSIPFDVAIHDKWRAILICREPSIQLSVPVPFVLVGTFYPQAYYVFSDDWRQVLSGVNVEEGPPFALCIDGFALAYNRALFKPAFRSKDRQGNDISFENPFIFYRVCEGYNLIVEAIISVRLPFALTVAKE